MQYSLPLLALGNVMQQLIGSYCSPELRSRQIEFKFMAGSRRTLLGPNTHAFAADRGIVVCVNVHWRLAPAEESALSSLEAVLLRLGATPHLAKLHHVPCDHVGRVLPSLSQFLDAARQVDPAGLFEPYRTFL